MNAVLQSLAEQVRERLAASRVTVRLRPERNMPIVAEALAPGVPSMRDERSIDQNAAATVRWVVAHQATLAVADARQMQPAPPREMIDQLGLRAFMIAPLFDGSRFLGTVSVHVNDEVRAWSSADIAALAVARDAVLVEVLGKVGG